MGTFDAVAELARRQHGTVTRSQLLALALTDHRVRTLVRSGVLARAAPGVYIIAGSPATWHQRLAIAVHLGGPNTLVSHRSAAGLWGFDRFRQGHLDVVTNWAGARTGSRAHLHRTTDLSSRDRTVRQDLAVTAPTRTLIDMGRYVSPTRLGSMIDDAVRRELTSYEDLASRTDELRAAWPQRDLDRSVSAGRSADRSTRAREQLRDEGASIAPVCRAARARCPAPDRVRFHHVRRGLRVALETDCTGVRRVPLPPHARRPRMG